MLDKIQIVKPAEIEKRSMEIITSELNGRTLPEPEFSIVKPIQEWHGQESIKRSWHLLVEKHTALCPMKM